MLTFHLFLKATPVPSPASISLPRLPPTSTGLSLDVIRANWRLSAMSLLYEGGFSRSLGISQIPGFYRFYSLLTPPVWTCLVYYTENQLCLRQVGHLLGRRQRARSDRRTRFQDSRFVLFCRYVALENLIFQLFHVVSSSPRLIEA